MKKYIKPILFILLLATSVIASSCQEETIQPTNTGMDDWYKMNT